MKCSSGRLWCTLHFCARVVRAKGGRKQVSKGYGFVSFADGLDMLKAMREKNGKFLGVRPMKLSRSKWKDRSYDAVKTEAKERRKKKRKIEKERLGRR